MHQILSLTTYLLVVQDLFDFVFLLVILERGTGTRRFSSGEQLRIIRDGGLEETCMEHWVDSIVRREVEFIRRRFRVCLNDFERSNVTVEELRALPLFLDLDAQVLGPKINGIIDLVFGVSSSVLICLYSLSCLSYCVLILREFYRFVDTFQEFGDSREF
jgi:hypothetical protein